MIRTALFGLGNVAERIHLPACRAISQLQLVAASEPREARRRELAERFDIPSVFADSSELLAEARPELVLVGTPPDSHRDLCLAALDAGADVFCEKPFMPTVADADRVLEAARERRCRVAVNTQYRHMAIYRRSREALVRGDFGRPYFIQVWQQMYHPAHLEPLEWRARLKRSTLFEFGTHALDLVCFLFDALPETISARIPRPRAEFDSDVLVHVTLTFPGERLATLAFNRISHAPERYLEMRVDCDDASLRISLGGVARASLDAVRHRGGRRLRPRLSFVQGGEARVEAGGRSWLLAKEPRTAFASATTAHLRCFLEARERGESLREGAEHAREILRLALLGYESAEAGRTLRFRGAGTEEAP